MNRRLLGHQQMPIGRADDRARHRAMIERHQAAVARDGECEEMAVGDRVVPQHARPVDHALRAKRHVLDERTGRDLHAATFDMDDYLTEPIGIEQFVDALLGVSPRKDTRRA